MCSNFEGVVHAVQFEQAFDVAMPIGGVASVWPGYMSSFVRKNNKHQREGLVGKFGMVPAWAGNDAKYAKLGLKTYNARCETVAQKPSYRDAWRLGQHCIVPADAIFEPDWRSGKALPARIARADQQPLGIAGLWTSYTDAAGNEVFSFTMLTINADNHAVFNNFHRAEDEKRMVVILQKAQFDTWLNAKAHESMALMQPIDADELVVSYPKPVAREPIKSLNPQKPPAKLQRMADIESAGLFDEHR
jgi:putative SOS response-associated peptidase YedK